MQWANMSDSTYDRAFKELKKYDYLIPAKGRKNIYLFREESESYQERQKEKDKIIISDEEEISSIFGLK